jgi:hypothetical protein
LANHRQGSSMPREPQNTSREAWDRTLWERQHLGSMSTKKSWRRPKGIAFSQCLNGGQSFKEEKFINSQWVPTKKSLETL